MRILIIGSNGFIGSTLCRQLSQYYTIIGAGRQTTNLSGCDINYKQLDLTDFDAIARIMSEACPEVIINCAAAISYNDCDKRLIDVNIRGLNNLIIVGDRLGIKHFIQLSSIPIIGIPAILPIDECHPVYPQTVYHLTKYVGEMLLSHAPFKSANLRIPSPVGAGMPDDKILPVLVNRALQNQDIILRGRGLRSQNYINVRDIAQGVLLCINKQAEGVFNLGASQSISNFELAEKCISLTGSNSRVKYEGEDKEEGNQWIISIKKAQEVLAFHPQFTIDDTIKELIEFYYESSTDK